jgi:hemerythrin superfamily protein
MADQETTTQSTATELLRQQHEQVKKMFGEFDQATGEQRQEIFDCVRATLAMHETAEEMIVYPEVRRIGDSGERIVKARLAEESDAKKMLADLEKKGVDAAGFEKDFASFRTAVLQHAEAEETEVFPLLDANIDAHKLREMADSILVAESVAPTHAHPHGPDSALGNLLVGPFVALVDKVRDRIAEHQKQKEKTGGR